MKKTTILTLCLVLLGMVPAMAQLNNILTSDDSQDDDLGKIWTNDFQNYALDLQSYLGNYLPGNLKPIQPSDSLGAINKSSSGDLNIPNPLEAAREVHDSVIQNFTSDPFENNPSLEAKLASNELNREITRGVVEGFLGVNGQTRIKTKLETTENAIKDITESIKKSKDNQNILQQAIENACEMAQSSPVGQVSAGLSACQTGINANVQLQMLKIQGEQVKIMAESLGQTIQMNQSQQYSNLNLVNVSQQMEEANRARRVDSSAEAARLLRATSQIDLFGREDQKNQ